MRQLKFARRPTPAEASKAAEALRWLEQRRVPPDWPASASAAFSNAGRRYILSTAQRHHRPETSLLQVVQAGYAAAIDVAQRHRQQPELWARLWAWRVREGVINYLTPKLFSTLNFNTPHEYTLDAPH